MEELDELMDGIGTDLALDVKQGNDGSHELIVGRSMISG